MHYTPKPLLTIAIAICISFSSFSQTDTSVTDLNLGRIKLKKDFTQSITIKGEQLEKMPFTSLYEAINAWSYGYYTNRTSVVYVIDGIVVNDVNAYSVYDIEEVTLVQNALIQASGATRQQQMALITTRKGGKDKQGMMVAGQSFLVRGDNVPISGGTNPKSETNFFHQYQIAAYQKGEKIQYGVSANYLRDVIPVTKNPGNKTNIPTNSDRFRINGWFAAKLGSAHDLTIRVNATPQVSDYDRSYGINLPPNNLTSRSKEHIKQTLFNPTIGLRSRLGGGFTNEFTASYGSSRVKGKNESETIYSPTNKYAQEQQSTLTLKQVLLMDQLSYHGSLGNNWSVEPSVNMMFRYLKNNNDYYQASTTNGNVTSINTSSFNQEGRIYLLTPSLNLYYKNSFNIQGGLVANLSKTYGQKIRKALPFVTTSVDVLRLANAANPTSLKFFGSIAQADNLGDLSPSLENAAAVTSFAFFGPTPGLPVYAGFPPDNSFWIWQTGTRLGILNNLLTVNYFFERRNFTAEVYQQIATSYRIIYPDIISSTHHLAINATLINKHSIYWLTGINATSIKSKTDKDLGFYTNHNVVGDLNSDKASWTGGWVNRFSWDRFTAGLDLLYYFNPDQLPTIPGDSKVDALSLQNVYVGYQLNLKGTKGLELYADCRNPKQDKDFKISGNRKYYGLGVKAIL
ncbi:hypothetical protein D3H65_13550 [Paraflavitalea soli]|uniref:TonB-dependent receptor n=1 Tax=Paraflavitalea soli TaxID=2315862 RepID=A0A3B7MNR0_9BACT|nr:hypothetical protein [Paraflavitalea soli]AXY74949.1 hypothetical protein D3H65_13550 [Paraflavitalea soli]